MKRFDVRRWVGLGNRRIWEGFLLMVGIWGGLVGCGQKPHSLTIAVIPKSMGEDFWGTVEQGARAAAADLGVQIEWQGPLTETDHAAQNSILENMVSRGVQGVAIAPLDRKASRKPVENAVRAGVPVVVFDSELDSDAYVSFVATNNEQGGRLGAEHLAKLLGGKGRVMCMRFVQGTGSTEARAKGFLEAAQAAGLTVLAHPHAEDATVAGCKKTALNTLESLVKQGRLELDGIFACNDRSTMGVLEALQDLAKSGVQIQVRFVGFDFTPRLIDALQKDQIDALVVQNPYKMGYMAVEVLVKHLRGEKVEKFYDTGVQVVTKQRLQEPEIRKLVGLKET